MEENKNENMQTPPKPPKMRMGHGPMGGMGAGEKAKDVKGTVGKLMRNYLKDYKWKFKKQEEKEEYIEQELILEK